MKILFVYPIPPREVSFINYLTFQQGIGFLSATLKQRGHQTELAVVRETDGAGLKRRPRFDRRALLRAIRSFVPDVVAISATTNQMPLVHEIVDGLRTTDLPIIIGGVHPTVDPDSVIEMEGVSGICIGEGEEALAEYVERLAQGLDPLDTRNFWLRNGRSLVKNSFRPLIEDLDSIPFPDREIFRFQRILNQSLELEMVAGRGCPFSCTNCINQAWRRIYKGMKRPYRRRSVGNVLAEIDEVLGRYRNVRTLSFHDDVFTLDKRWVSDFCDRYRGAFPVPFRINTRVDMVDREVIADLKRAGCAEIRYGIESGNAFIRNEVLKAEIDEEKIVTAFAMTKEAGIRAFSFSMIGLPYETPAMVEETIRLNRRVRPDKVFVSIFQPYPGTESAELCKREGWLTDRHVSGYFDGNTVIDQPTISAEEVRRYFYLFPWIVMMPALAGFVRWMSFVRIGPDGRDLYFYFFQWIKRMYRLRIVYMERPTDRILVEGRKWRGRVGRLFR